MANARLTALAATFRREITAHRLNRFLHVHLAIAAVAGLLPLFTPAHTSGAAPWWLLQAVLYALSLSALLLGLSSAHGEAEELALLFTQPVQRWVWLSGKAAGLAALIVPAALLLIAPAALVGGLTVELAGIAAATAGLTLALAAAGLALGLWIRDGVRGLLAVMGLWFVLLFGADLLLLAVSGAPWVHRYPTLWIVPLMINPLDALRITVLFGFGDAAPAALDGSRLAGWWIGRSQSWLALVLVSWTLAGFLAAVAGSRRSVDV